MMEYTILIPLLYILPILLAWLLSINLAGWCERKSAGHDFLNFGWASNLRYKIKFIVTKSTFSIKDLINASY